MYHDPQEDAAAASARSFGTSGHLGAEPANLRFLRRLVTVLTATMILGILGIALLFFLRMPSFGPPVLPETITLPEGATATAFTQGQGWFAVVTEDEHILIYDAASGALRQIVRVKR